MHRKNTQVVLRARHPDLGSVDVDGFRTLKDLIKRQRIQMAEFAVEVDVELLKCGCGADKLGSFWIVLLRDGEVDVAEGAEMVERIVADGQKAFNQYKSLLSQSLRYSYQ